MNTPWSQERWQVSPYNFAPEVLRDVHLSRNLMVSDGLLRDGEQQAGIVFGSDDKLRIAQILDDIGIPEIEVGMPSVSEQEAEAVSGIAKAGLKAKIRTLCMATKGDVDLSARCGAEVISISLPAGYLQIKYKLRWSEERIIQTAIDLTNYAHQQGLYVVFSPMDTTRSDLDFLRRYIRAVVEAGHVDRVRITDTAGAATPAAIKHLVKNVVQISQRPVEIHCHDDFGLATANILAGLEAGASVASTALNGLGERAGNAATEEVVLALRMLYNVDLGLDLKKLYQASLLVQERSGTILPPHKAVVGRNALAQEAGAVVAGWIVNPFTAEPYLPEVVGQTDTILLGKWSGKASVAWKLRQMGISTNEEEITAITRRVKEAAEMARRPVSDGDLLNICRELRENR